LGERLRMRRILEIGHPDRAPVAAPTRRERPEVGEVVAARRPACPDVLAVLDAGRRVADRQLDEVAHLGEVLRVRVRDDVEAGAAAGIAGLGAERPDAGAGAWSTSSWRGSSAPMMSFRWTSISMSSSCQ